MEPRSLVHLALALSLLPGLANAQAPDADAEAIAAFCASAGWTSLEPDLAAIARTACETGTLPSLAAAPTATAGSSTATMPSPVSPVAPLSTSNSTAPSPVDGTGPTGTATSGSTASASSTSNATAQRSNVTAPRTNATRHPAAAPSAPTESRTAAAPTPLPSDEGTAASAPQGKPRPTPWQLLLIGGGDATPRMAGEIRLEQTDFVHVALVGSLDMETARFQNFTVKADRLRAAHAAALGSSVPADAALLVKAIEDQARQVVEASVRASGLRIEWIDATLDAATLSTAAVGAPVRIDIAGALVQTLPEAREPTFDATARALLAAGGRAGTRVALETPIGADITYVLLPPPGLAFASPSVGIVGEAGEARIRQDATGRNVSLVTRVDLTLVDPGAAPTTAEDIRVSLDIALAAPAGASMPIALEATLGIHALEVASRMGPLPANVSLTHLRADDLRALRAAGALDDDALDALDARLRQAFADRLGAIAATDIRGGLDRASLARAGPLAARIAATASQPLADAEASRLLAALDAGAGLRLDVPLPALPDVAATLVVWPGAHIVGHPDGLRVDGQRNASFEIRSALVQPVGSDDVSLRVTVDAREVRFAREDALAGALPEVVLDVRAQAIVRAIALPADVLAALDPRVNLTHLSADGLRVLAKAGLVDAAALAGIEAQLLVEAATALQGAPVAGGFVVATLGRTAAPGAPILFEATARLAQPITGGTWRPDQAAAAAIYAAEQVFSLPRIGGLPTEYEVLFPRGLLVEDVRATGGTARALERDGRHGFTARSDDEDLTVRARLVATPQFLSEHFAPYLVVLVGAIAVLLELALGGAWIVVHRLRVRRTRATRIE